MKIAYSILLRELIKAKEVDYGDCSTFQITCPNCHEAVFKSGKYNSPTRQFFSHYANTQANVEQCELRVAIISERTIKERNAIGHGQTLDVFFETFQDKLLRWIYPNDFENVRRRINWMMSRTVFIESLTRYKGGQKDNDVAHDMIEAIAIEQSTHPLIKLSKSFYLEQQTRFAKEFGDHLLAPNSTKAWTFIYALVVYMSGELPDYVREAYCYYDNNKFKKALVKFLDTMLTADEIAKNWKSFCSYSPKMFVDHSVLVALGCIFIHKLAHLLICIPYTSMLSETNNISIDYHKEMLKTEFKI